VTFLAIFARPGRPPGAHEAGLERVLPLLGRDKAVPQVSCRPLRVQFTLKNPFIFAGMTPWNTVFNRTPQEQTATYRSDVFRNDWKAEMERRRATGLWSRITIRDASSPNVTALAGQSVAEIAAARNVEPHTAFLDVALEDNLDTLFDYPVFNQDPEAVKPLVTDPRFLIGLSDGGAHVDQLCDVGYATYLLGKWVRQWQALTLERAVHRLTGEVADFFGIPNRGCLKPGAVADMVLFDPDTVDDMPAEYVHDLPNGAKRLIARAKGVDATIVAGQVVYRDGQPTGARPGTVLRGGKA
jgi:N-acyl-D-aspartate/D-glutamate deacylase